ncbi:MAG: FKBP-type peptidyl-prolyl cis-trans isomerase [Chitinophagales bacterium]
MLIAKNKVVLVSYQLTDASNDATIIENVKADSPFAFLFGAGSLLPEFERNLKGKKAGDDFHFTIPAAQGYGVSDKNAIVDLPKSQFALEGQMGAGQIHLEQLITVEDQHGRRFEGKIVAIKEDFITLDFNHPLADIELRFKGKVIQVRDASPEEIAHKHAHGPGGHHH